jgi:hypothetical protein
MGGTGAASCAERIFSRLSVTGNRASNQSFYNWRKRLPGKITDEPARFALVEPEAPIPKDTWPVELILASGDRLHIAPGTDAATTRTVLNVLKERA